MNLPGHVRLFLTRGSRLHCHARNLNSTKILHECMEPDHAHTQDKRPSNSYQISATLRVNLTTDKEKNESYIEAVPTPSGREGKVVETKNASNACVLCRLNLPKLDYTDVMILSQFLEEDGKLLTYHETKLCTKQYLTVKDLVKKAQRCNLLARPADYLVPGPWHDLNTYIERDRKRDQPMKAIKKEYWKI